MAMRAVVGPITTPLEVIEQHATAMRDIAQRLVVANEGLRKVETDLHNRMNDALDEVYELKLKLREKDGIIEELQAMLARRGQ